MLTLLLLVACADDGAPAIDSRTPNHEKPSLSWWYADNDGDGYGDPDLRILAESKPPNYVENREDCDDFDPRIHPAARELCADGIDNNCDEFDPLCRPEGTLQLADEHARWWGSVVGEMAGNALSLGVDVTADGRADVLVGASEQFADSAGLRAGGAYLLDAASSGDLADLGLRIWGEAYRWGGWNSALVPDLSGDGVGEVLLPASRYDELCVFYGPIDSARVRGDADVCIALEPDVSSEFGYTAVHLGDQSGDGIGDLLVSGTGNIYMDGAWAPSLGRAYVFYGPVDNYVHAGEAEARLTLNPANARAGLGRALCAGDFSGDGIRDLALGAPMIGNEWVPEHLVGGLIAVVAGPLLEDHTLDDGLGNSVDATAIWRGEQRGARAGYALACDADVNGDGRDDLLVGSPGDGSMTSAAYLLSDPTRGDGSLADADWAVAASAAFVGASVTASSDLNGDQHADIAVVAAGSGSPDRVVIFYGGPLTGRVGLDASDAILQPEAEDDYLTAVAGGADLDEDGLDDLLIAKPGWPGSDPESATIYWIAGGIDP